MASTDRSRAAARSSAPVRPEAPHPAAHAGRWLLSLVFNIQMFAVMALMSVFYAPWAAFDRRGAHRGVRAYCRYVRFSARWMLGLRSEIRGTVPYGEVLIAAKHQSFFDIILICSVVPRPKFIMKAELRRAPILGWFALRMGCVPVERGRRGAAITQMLADVAAGRIDPGQLIIYPQGTRVAPGVAAPYKAGAGALYAAADLPCIPAATNAGLFWPRKGILRRRGCGVVAFLDPIAPGLTPEAFLDRLESVVEPASEALGAEAGAGNAGPPPNRSVR